MPEVSIDVETGQVLTPWRMRLWRLDWLLNPNWSSLRALGTSPVVRLTPIVPVLGYLIMFNDKVSQYLVLSAAVFGVDLHPVPSTQMLFLYFGLTSLAAASILFQSRCPLQIKTYASPAEYIAAMNTASHAFQRDTIVLALDANRESKLMLEHLERQRAKNRSTGVMTAEQDFWNGVFSQHYMNRDKWRRGARIAVGGFYTLGFALLAYPTLDVFYRVSRYTVSAMWP